MYNIEKPIRLLIIDHDEMSKALLQQTLQQSAELFELQSIQTIDADIEHINFESYGCVFLSCHSSEIDTVRLISQLRLLGVETPLIVLTDRDSHKSTTKLIEAGAFDCLQRDVLSSELLIRAVKSAIRVYEAERQVSRLKSEFLATMSHELRTPLHAIIGFSQILMNQFKSQANTDQQDMICRTLTNGQHLLSLINEVLEFSNIKSGQIQLQSEVVNVAQLVSRTVESLQPLAKPKQIDLKVCVKLENPIITNDSGRLRKVISGLISNAIKFTESGEVRVSVSELLPDMVRISVEDTGIGVAAQNLPCIFDAFYQIDQSMSRKYSGIGLGLTISSSLLEIMGGTLSVNSHPGQGSHFIIHLPRN
ncbi:MAG: ATP-binding protein [Leptolyngbyaceae cyanobacterium]